MEQELIEWSVLWQQESAKGIDINTFIGDLEKIERKAKGERLAILFAIPLTLIVLYVALAPLSLFYRTSAILLIGGAMIMILWMLYRSKLTIGGETAELNTTGFLNHNITALKRRWLTTKRYMWIYTLLLVAGLNIGYFELFMPFETSTRLLIHGSLTITMIFLMYLGIRARLKKYEIELLPLIKELESVQQETERN